MTPVADRLAALVERVDADTEGTADIAFATLNNALWDVRHEIVAVLRRSEQPICGECWAHTRQAQHADNCTIGALAARLGPLLEDNE